MALTARPSRRLLVDGNNVMGSRPDGWWRDRDGAQLRLARELGALAQREGLVAEVIFDGRGWPVPDDLGDHVVVGFATRPGRDAADDDLAVRVAEDGDPARLTVVTSDRALADRVRDAGAGEVLGARTLLDRLA